MMLNETDSRNPENIQQNVMGCPVEMSDKKPCGRPICPAPTEVDWRPVCLMHSHLPTKDQRLFRQEIKDILSGTSTFHRPNDRFDFVSFVFPSIDFGDFVFTKYANFGGTTFFGHGDFGSAQFEQGAYWGMARFLDFANFSKAKFATDTDFIQAWFGGEATFAEAMFSGEANFWGTIFSKQVMFVKTQFTRACSFFNARFIGDGYFSAATFCRGADFKYATFGANTAFTGSTFGVTEGASVGQQDLDSPICIADFTGTGFLKPKLVNFNHANKNSSTGLRLRMLNCNMEEVEFEDVRWHRHLGRRVLQDELDVMGESGSAREEPEKRHELVAIAYRRLANMFEKSRAYDIAEDFSVGAMAMGRLDPENFLFARRLAPHYRKRGFLHWLGENVSALGIYNFASHYGSSYRRAFAVLLFVVLIFGVAFSLSDLESTRKSSGADSTNLLVKVSERYLGGFFHSLEIAAFRRDTYYVATSRSGRILVVLESVLVPSQLALLVLALRRRFRR
jgi:hypothetical protein